MILLSQDTLLNEDHPLALNLSFSVSLGLLPAKLSLKTTGCGIKRSEFTLEDSGDSDSNSKDYYSDSHFCHSFRLKLYYIHPKFTLIRSL